MCRPLGVFCKLWSLIMAVIGHTHHNQLSQHLNTCFCNFVATLLVAVLFCVHMKGG